MGLTILYCIIPDLTRAAPLTALGREDLELLLLQVQLLAIIPICRLPLDWVLCTVSMGQPGLLLRTF